MIGLCVPPTVDPEFPALSGLRTAPMKRFPLLVSISVVFTAIAIAASPLEKGASWIGASDADVRTPLLRTEFAVDGDVTRAIAKLTAVGAVDLFLNGTEADDSFLAPGPSQPERRIFYSELDVTSHIRPGANTVGLWLGEGQAAITRTRFDRFHNLAHRYPGPYPAPLGILSLEIHYASGRTQTIVTDSSWRWSTSPLTYANFYGGEDYDARLEQPGWSTPGFDDATWKPVVVSHDVTAELTPRLDPPMRVVDVLEPIAERELGGGVRIYDLGQNIGGIWRVRVKGNPGDVVTIRASESLDNSHTVGDFATARGVNQVIFHGRGGFFERDVITRYTLRGGEEEEIYTPRFFYSGMRFIQVEESARAALEHVSVEGLSVHTDVPWVGSFACSDERLNRLYLNTAWSIKGIIQGAPMSNPNSEKYGWTGDAHLFADASYSIFDIAPLWDKWLVDLKDVQDLIGGGRTISNVVPAMRFDDLSQIATAVWGAAYPLAAWHQYRYTGDPAVYETYYQPLSRWADYLASTAKDGLVGGRWADHMTPGVMPDGTNRTIPVTPNLQKLLGTAYYARTERVVAEMAAVLGHDDDAAVRRARADRAEGRINEAFFNNDAGRYEVEPAEGHFPLQTANLKPLQFGFVPTGREAQVLGHVLHDISETHNGHLRTGIVGTKALVKVLLRAGEADLLHQLATQPTAPGWGYWLAEGATTHWQSWYGRDNDLDLNHAMFAPINEFLTAGIAGILPPTEKATSPGWKRVTIRPQFPTELDWATATVPTPQGLLSSRWERTPGGVGLELTIPEGSDARLELPRDVSDVSIPLGGRPPLALDLASGIHRLQLADGQLKRLP